MCHCLLIIEITPGEAASTFVSWFLKKKKSGLDIGHLEIYVKNWGISHG